MTLRFGLILVPPLPTSRAELSTTSTPGIPDFRSETQTTFSGSPLVDELEGIGAHARLSFASLAVQTVKFTPWARGSSPE